MSRHTYNPNPLQGSQSSSSDGEREEEGAEEEPGKPRFGNNNDEGGGGGIHGKVDRTASAIKEKQRTE